MAEQTLQTTILNPEMMGQAVEAPAERAPEPRRLRDPKPADKHGWWWGTGRRKTAVARVRLRPARQAGQGTFQIQITRKKFKDLNEYFTEPRDRRDAASPAEVAGVRQDIDVFVRVQGGGFMGQAQAIRLGLARAILGYEPRHEPGFREAGFLSRDARKVERKKYGQPGARRRFQFSKR